MRGEDSKQGPRSFSSRRSRPAMMVLPAPASSASRNGGGHPSVPLGTSAVPLHLGGARWAPQTVGRRDPAKPGRGAQARQTDPECSPRPEPWGSGTACGHSMLCPYKAGWT